MTDGLKDAHRAAIIAEVAANDRVERAVLFGSRATGTNTVSSDVDIALFGDRLTLTDQARLAAALDEISMAQSVDLLLYDSVTNRTLREHIRRQGVEWYARPTRDEAYDASPDFGCPGDWTLKKLGRACIKIGSGATPRGGKEVYVPSGPYALIRSQNVLNDGFRHDGLAYIGEQHAFELAGVEVLEGDVLLNITGDSVARACQVDPHVLPARVNQHVAIIRPDPAKLDPGFLRYFLVCPETQAKLLSWAGSGGTRNALTKGMIEAFDVPAPEDIREQRAIARVLGTLDDKIELNRRMNATQEAMAGALFQSWFVDFDPVRPRWTAATPGCRRTSRTCSPTEWRTRSWERFRRVGLSGPLATSPPRRGGELTRQEWLAIRPTSGWSTCPVDPSLWRTGGGLGASQATSLPSRIETFCSGSCGPISTR